ncbi:MAG: GAF domain-containing protein [Vicinamibacterales bacterium]
MHSRPVRLTLIVLAWIALGGPAFFLFQSQQQIDQRRTSLRTFEASARDAADALDDALAGQQAYVALGQEAVDWIPKVSTYLQTASASIDALRASATTGTAGPVLLEASTAMTQLTALDRQVRESIAAEDFRGAADAVFSDGADAVSSAMSNVDAAMAAEQQGADDFEAAQRRLQIYAAAGGVGVAALLTLLLGLTGTTAGERSEAEEEATSDSVSLAGLARQVRPADAPVQAASDLSPETLGTIADLCTRFIKVREASEINPLLESAAGALNARGLIVWLGDAAGSDLRPVLAYGYRPQTLAKLRPLARTADNVAAVAYRTGELQVEPSLPDGQQGTIVAPLMSPDGCIGAVTAEVRDGGERSESVRACSQILAAQLAGLLASAADAARAESVAHSAAG